MITSTVTATESTSAPAIPEQAKSEVNQAIGMYDRAQSLTIVTVEDYSNAGAFLHTIKNRAKEIDTLRMSMTRPLDDAKAKIMSFFRPATDKLNDAATIISRTMITWETEQERIRKEAQAKAEEAARKRSEDENIALAAELERSGDTELAEQVLTSQVEVAPVKIASSVPRTATAFSRETWSGEVTNLMELVKAIAEGKAPISLVQANMVAINGVARSLKSSMKYPGIRAVSSKSMTSRRS